MSNDYVPLFPWAGFTLAGVGLAGLVASRLDAARAWRPRTAVGRALVFAGRHSLVIYLTHQIVLLGILGGLAQLLRG